MKQVYSRVCALLFFATFFCINSVSAQLTGSLLSQTNVGCFNGNNGSATVTQSGGTGPYTYLWSPSGGTNATGTALAAGTYTCTITDQFDMSTATVTVAITQPTPLIISNIAYYPNDTVCLNQAVHLTPTVSGGTAPYTYFWSDPMNSLSCINCLDPYDYPPGTITHTFAVVDANNCMEYSFATVVVSPTLAITTTSNPATCNQANGEAYATAVGGNPPFAYLWSNNATNDTASNLPAGIYTVSITDANGCTGSGQIAVNNLGGPTINFTGVTNPTCYNFTNGTATASVSGNAPPYQFYWNTSPAQVTATAINVPTGQYFCTVTDTNGCQSTASLALTQPPQLYLGQQILAPENCAAGGTARAWALGGNPPYTYLWSNNSTNDTAMGIPGGNGSVILTDNSGCSVQATFTMPSTTNAVITGRAYEDMNGNCIYDGGDFPIMNQSIYITPWNLWATTDANGIYTRASNSSSTQTVSTSGNFSTPYTTGLCPANSTQTVTFSGLCDTAFNVDFARQALPGIQDLRVSMSSWIPHLAMPQWVHIQYSNVGTVAVANCTLSLVYDTILGYMNSNAVPSTNTSGYLEWQLGTLQPGQSGIITVNLQVPNVPIGYIGRPLFYAATINPIAGDTCPTDNGDDELRHIVASFDPNAKIVDAPGLDSIGNITPTDTLLSYTLFFQNTGNATAFNIYLEDTLSQYLDPSTVVPGVSSHPYSFELYGNGIMRFSFYNILLPDSNNNEPASHGFVKYQIKVQNNLPLGTTILNTAYIYFDFNPAVITNTTSNTIWLNGPTNVEENSSEGISVYPNPFDESTTLLLPESMIGPNQEIILTDATGRIVQTQQANNVSSLVIQKDQLAPGIYFCTVWVEGQIAGQTKLVVQ